MPRTAVRRLDGTSVGEVTLDDAVFGVTPNVPVMHQVVTAQLAAARAGTQSARTRAEVSGGGSKPWRQKGTGRARQGSTRAPHWTGGGVALAPKPRSYRQRTPKKMVQLALRSALSARAADERVAVVERWSLAAPRTRDAKLALAALGLDGKVLAVLEREDEVARKSLRNLPAVRVIAAEELNAYDVLCSDWLLFTLGSLPGSTDRSAAPTAAAAAPSPAAAPAPPPAAPPAASEGTASGTAPAGPTGTRGAGASAGSTAAAPGSASDDATAAEEEGLS